MEPPEPFNPYAPPRAPTDAPIDQPRPDTGLASRWQRLGGALFDSLLRLIAILPGYAGVPSVASVAQTGARLKNPFYLYTNAGKWGVVAAVASAALLALQWWLLVKRGQTVGKMIAQTRIVRKDGARADFVTVLVLRAWPMWVVEILGGMTGLFALVGTIDDLFVFRQDRRCLHDLIAGTRVLRVDGG